MSLVYVTYRVNDKQGAEVKKKPVLVRGSLGEAVTFFESRNSKAIVLKAELSEEGLMVEEGFQFGGAAGNESAKRSTGETRGRETSAGTERTGNETGTQERQPGLDI